MPARLLRSIARNRSQCYSRFAVRSAHVAHRATATKNRKRGTWAECCSRFAMRSARVAHRATATRNRKRGASPRLAAVAASLCEARTSPIGRRLQRIGSAHVAHRATATKRVHVAHRATATERVDQRASPLGNMTFPGAALRAARSFGIKRDLVGPDSRAGTR